MPYFISGGKPLIFKQTQRVPKPSAPTSDNFIKYKINNPDKLLPFEKLKPGQNVKILWSKAKETEEELLRQAEMKKERRQTQKRRMLDLIPLASKQHER